MRWVCLAALLSTVAGCNNKALPVAAKDIPPDYISNNCSQDQECDDGNPCTDDSCSSIDSTCTNTPKDCSAVKDDCNSASCDTASGDCVGIPRRENQGCSDPIFGDPGVCMQGTCEPLPQCDPGNNFLDCGVTITSSTVGNDAVFDSYSCSGATNLTGPEVGYDFYVSTDRTVTLTLDSSADLDLLVLNGAVCVNTASCNTSSLTTGSGQETVTFSAFAFTDYTVIVEGRGGASGAYTLKADCIGCKPIQQLDCNQSVMGNTGSANATSVLSDWTCNPGDTGPEETYTLMPVNDTDYTIKLSGLTQDLDLIITDQFSGTCDYFCLSDSSTINSGTTDETLTYSTSAGQLYYVVVDSKNAPSAYMLEVDCAATCAGAGAGFGCATGSDAGRNDDPVKSTNRVNEWKNCDSDTTGREVIYHFAPIATGTYDFDLVGLTADLDLIVVEGTATTCDPVAATCLTKSTNHDAGNLLGEHVSFTGTAGHDYYVAVDGVNGAVGNYTLRMTSGVCPAWQCASSVSPTLDCTWLDDTRRNDDPSRSKDVVDAWTCDPDATGPEVVYVFTPAQDGDYTVTLDQLGADLDLVVLSGMKCDPSASCLANLRTPPPSPSPSPSPDPTPSPTPSPSPSPDPFPAESVSFHGLAGKPQYLVVDGRDGAAGNYHIHISGDCAAPVCKNGSNSLSCVTTSTSNANDARGATNDINAWGAGGSCASGTTGPEFAHLFSPNGAGPYTVTLTGLAADLDLIVLEAGAGNSCDPGANCLGASQNTGNSDEMVMFTADPTKKYWLIVDGKNAATSAYQLNVSGCP